MIAPRLQGMIGEALKAHDEIRLSTLRLLSSAFNYEFIAKQHKLTEEEEMAVIQREAKKRKEAIEALRQAQGKLTTSSSEDVQKRLAREEEELKVLQEFLPPEISEEELVKLVDEAVGQVEAKSLSDMGKVIGMVKSKAPGADGAKIAELVKVRLQHD